MEKKQQAGATKGATSQKKKTAGEGRKTKSTGQASKKSK